MFEASCDRHDYSYAIGGDEADRQRADEGFLRAMLRDAARAPWWKRWWYRLCARAYYRAVRWGGGFCFTYREPGELTPDLDQLLDEAIRRRTLFP